VAPHSSTVTCRKPRRTRWRSPAIKFGESSKAWRTATGIKASNDVDIKSERSRLSYRKVEANRAVVLHAKEYASTKTRDEAETEQELAEFALSKEELERKMSLMGAGAGPGASRAPVDPIEAVARHCEHECADRGSIHDTKPEVNGLRRGQRRQRLAL
jgi:hypothetical protein